MCRVGQNRIYTPYISINVWFWPTLYVCLCVCVSGLACFACIYVCVCVCVRVCVCVSGIMYLHHVCTPLLLFQIPCQGHNQSPDPQAVNTAAYEIMRMLAFKPHDYIIVHCTHGFNRTGGSKCNMQQPLRPYACSVQGPQPTSFCSALVVFLRPYTLHAC